MDILRVQSPLSIFSLLFLTFFWCFFSLVFFAYLWTFETQNAKKVEKHTKNTKNTHDAVCHCVLGTHFLHLCRRVSVLIFVVWGSSSLFFIFSRISAGYFWRKKEEKTWILTLFCVQVHMSVFACAWKTNGAHTKGKRPTKNETKTKRKTEVWCRHDVFPFATACVGENSSQQRGAQCTGARAHGRRCGPRIGVPI